MVLVLMEEEGNPLNPEGYPTSYLWENVFKKDSMMDIIQNFFIFKLRKIKKYYRTVQRSILKNNLLFFQDTINWM